MAPICWFLCALGYTLCRKIAISLENQKERSAADGSDFELMREEGPLVKALNFYSSVYHAFLVSRDKTCTIRLGDKTYKYQDGDVVLVTYGDKFKQRRKVFTAVLDQVRVKRIGDLTAEDLQGENPEMKSPADAVEFLSQIYKSPITMDSVVTVVHFSEIIE